MFDRIDLDKSGVIDYHEFLIGTMDDSTLL